MVERIKARCKEMNTTMGTLEKELGFANGSIRRWDERMPGVDRAYILANRLQVSIEWLLTGKEAGEPMTEDEQLLLSCYRMTDDRGKRTILRTAKAESGEETSSTSGIG